MLSFFKKLFPAPVDYAMLVDKGGLVIDVRTASEYDTGHIKGSKNIPLDRLRNEITRLKQLNVPIITVCRSGNRSGMAKSLLTGAGVEAYNGGPWNSLAHKLKK